MSQKSQARRDAIVNLAMDRLQLSVEEIAQHFGVTTSTIRRDLARLSEEGLLTRTYGGAMARRVHREPSLEERWREAAPVKRAIAARARELVSPDDTVFLDAGTSCAALAGVLPATTPLTVVTAGMTSLQALSGAEGIELLSLGGRLRHLSQGFIGPLAEMALERLTFDICFLGADGVTADRGICEASLEQIRLKELMINASDQVVVLAHSSKLGQRPFNAWVWPRDPWVLITDSGISDETLAAFASRRVKVLTAEPEDIDPDASRIATGSKGL